MASESWPRLRLWADRIALVIIGILFAFIVIGNIAGIIFCWNSQTQCW